MKVNLQFKIIGIVALISLIFFSVIGYVNVKQQSQILEESFIEKAESIARVLDASIKDKKDLEDKSKLLSIINKNIWLDADILKISISRPYQDSLITTVSNDQNMIEKLCDEDSTKSYRDNILISKFVVNKESSAKVLRVITPVHIAGQVVGTFQIDLIFENIENRITDEIVRTVLFTILTMAITIVLMYIFLRFIIIKPIFKINAGVVSIMKDKLDYKIEIKSKDEIGQLALSFNQMTEDLKESREKLIDARDNLEKKVEERTKELSDSKNRIEQQNIKLKKLDQIKSEFLNNTSHELRTPITGVKGYVQMMLNQSLGEITEEQKNALEVILRNSDRLDHLVQDILDISQLESRTMKFKPQQTDIRKLVSETVESMKPCADLKKIKINSKIENNLPELFVDNDRIKQVMMNLVNNAIKFSPDGSIINVRAKNDTDHVLFEVQDFGRGIAKKEEKRVFDTFYQVDSGMDRKFGGVGLGLTISQSIVAVHGGKIWVESTVGKGSSFRFTLPINSVQDVEGRFKEVDVFRVED